MKNKRNIAEQFLLKMNLNILLITLIFTLFEFTVTTLNTNIGLIKHQKLPIGATRKMKTENKILTNPMLMKKQTQKTRRPTILFTKAVRSPISPKITKKPCKIYNFNNRNDPCYGSRHDLVVASYS